MARLTSEVHTVAARPYSVSLAPRDHRAHHADRLSQRQDQVIAALVRRQRLAGQLVGPARVVIEHVRDEAGRHGVDLAEAQRDAVVERLQPQQLIAVRPDQVRDRAQHPDPLAAVPGEGRVPRRLPTMMIDPPPGWPCMTSLAAWAMVWAMSVQVAAVHGFCLGGGVGLAGNADIVVAAEDATFGLPEVDRGALGAATHLARLVPQPLMRAMVYTCRTVTARQLLAFGTVLDVVPKRELRGAARDLAEEIAAKDPAVIRLAKQSLNGIDPVDVKRSYRYEQGFTFELNLAGAGDEARQAFVDKKRT
jgi:Enoyl-CoA hydratase/isomerase